MFFFVWLGHPKICLFITHGGALSTMEAAYHGVPLIGLPMFVDQDTNMQQISEFGIGLTLEIMDLTQDGFRDAIAKIFRDSRFNTYKKCIAFHRSMLAVLYV